MTIKIIEDSILWDNFVDDSPHGLLFHKWAFLKTVEKHLGYQLTPYGIYKGNLLIGILPLFYKRINGLKTIFSPPPMSAIPYLGLAMLRDFYGLKQNMKEEYLNIAIDEVNQEIEKISPNYIYLSLDKSITDTRPFIWCGYELKTSYTYVIELNQELGNIWSNFPSRLRQRLRKAEKLQLKIEVHKNASLLYNMMKERYHQKGMNLPIVSSLYLQELLDHFQKELVCYSVYAPGIENPIQTYIICNYKSCILWLGGVSTGKIAGVGNYFVWKMIEKAKEEGFNELEYLGANVKSLCLNRRYFNPSLEMSFSVYKKDFYGKMGEWIYRNFVKKKWI